MGTGPGNKPLTSSAFFVLLGLSAGARHGLGIAEEVSTRSGGNTQLGPGSLYTALKKLLRDELVDETEPTNEHHIDPRRRYYRLTPAGRTALAKEANRLDQIVAMAHDLQVLDEMGS